MSTVQGFEPKMKGTFIGALLVAGASKDATGLFTISSTFSGDLHTGFTLGGFDYRVMNRMVDSAPTDQQFEDNVVESSGVEITIIEKRVVGAIPLLEAIVFGGFNYVRVQRNFLPPGATNPQVFGAMLAISEFDGGETEKGPLQCTLTGVAAGISPFVVSGGASLPF